MISQLGKPWMLALVFSLVATGCALFRESQGSIAEYVAERTLFDSAGRVVSPARAGGLRVFIFASEYSCRECIYKVNEVLESQGERIQEIYLLGRAQQTRPASIANAVEFMKSLSLGRTIFIDAPDKGVRDEWPPKSLEGGWYGRLGISITPAVLMVSGRGEILFINYADLTLTASSMDLVISGAIDQLKL